MSPCPSLPRRFRAEARRGPLLGALAALLATGLLAVPLAGPAAAVPGLVTVQRTSPEDSTAQKVVSVPCPSGTRAIGGSAVVGGSSRVRINTAVPDAAGYSVLAREVRGGTTVSWYVVVTARCAPATALPGLEYRRVDSRYDSAAGHGATAACSPGKRVIGTGAVLDSNGSGQDRLVLASIRPAADLTGVRVSGAEDEAGYSGNWRVSAVAACVTPLVGQQLVTAATGSDSLAAKRSAVACPSGTQVHAGGFDIGSGDGQVGVTSAFLDLDVAGDPARQGFEVAAREDPSGYTGRWRTVALAVCAA